jgi:hypothetical protein
MATTAPPSDKINIPGSVACRLFSMCSAGYVYRNCNSQFRLGFKLGGKWFYVPSEALVDKSTDDGNGQCKLDLYAMSDETVWFGQPFLNYHCTLNDRKNYLGIAKKPDEMTKELNDDIVFDMD